MQVLSFIILVYFLVTNPCAVQNGGCQHLCVLSHTLDNDGLGYKCLCDPGYSIDVDGKTCRGEIASSSS